MVKVSVIVPMYGVEATLERCLDSVVGQTLEDIEVVCVDDGSPDASAQIAAGYAARDARVRLLRQENRGLGAARNAGIDAARGQYVTFLDSDDALGQPEYLEALYDAAVRNRCPLAVCGMVKIKPHKRVVKLRFEEREVLETPRQRFEVTHCPPDFYCMNRLYLRRRLNELGMRFAEGRLFEDVEFTCRALTEMGPMVTVPEVYYAYYLNPQSITKSRTTPRKQRDRYLALSAMTRYCREHGIRIARRYTSVPISATMLGPLTLLKWRERGDRQSLRLFDLLPIYSKKAKP